MDDKVLIQRLKTCKSNEDSVIARAAAERIRELLLERNALARGFALLENAVELNIVKITEAVAKRILTAKLWGRDFSVKGRFWLKSESGRYIGIDNSTGITRAEEFITPDACLRWLTGDVPMDGT